MRADGVREVGDLLRVEQVVEVYAAGARAAQKRGFEERGLVEQPTRPAQGLALDPLTVGV